VAAKVILKMMRSSLPPVRLLSSCLLLCSATALLGQAPPEHKTIDLPTSKQLIEPVPGAPQKTNGLPLGFAMSPDGKYLAAVNAGYGTFESNNEQSISILEIATGKVTDFPEERTAPGMPQTYYSGLAFSPDGTHLYAVFDSLKAPEGGQPGRTGNAIAVYGFDAGKVSFDHLIPIGLQKLAAGRTQNPLESEVAAGSAIPVPAGVAAFKSASGDRLLVADEFSDDALVIDAATGKVVYRYDFAEKTMVPTEYPIAVAVSRDGRHGFVALWNGSAVAEVDLDSGALLSKIQLLPPSRETSPSSHPTALVFSPDEKYLYVALANRDAVAAVEMRGTHMKLDSVFDTRLPGQNYFGAMPDAVALSADGSRLYAANTGSNAVAVFDTRGMKKHGMAWIKPLGFVPTEWYPTAVAVKDNQLFVATGKGQGTGPNKEPPPVIAGHPMLRRRAHTYIASLLHGSLATIDRVKAEADLKTLTDEALTSNREEAAQKHAQFANVANPIRHVIYIIKENRTYDQILGDLGAGDDDPSLTMYGRSVTPNIHKLAEQFGVLDNFYDSGEVSGDGHVWSTAAITSDYTEKNWQQAYRGSERVYDFEGVVENRLPLTEGIPDVNEPNSGYLWTNLGRHDKTLYHFGEYIATTFCNDRAESAPKAKSPKEGTPEMTSAACKRSFIQPGEEIPANYGGGKSKYPWPIPMIADNKPTKPELVGHFDPDYPDFELAFPDQLRVEEFLTHFRDWVRERGEGHDRMPQFIMLRLPNDHTAGTRPGMPTPQASVADNDLAVGRAVEAVSHSAYWNDTAFFVLEDDAQDGADHVDAHRSLALVVSKYARQGEGGKPVVDHTFYTTVSVIHTMEDLLGLPPMNNNDAFAPIIDDFSGDGEQPAYQADYSNRDNGLIYTANQPKNPGAKESSRMDFRHADQADAVQLNVVLWKNARGSQPVPEMVLHPHEPQRKDSDD
jgi:DNA-binding beta-propeller fold protein YncE